MTNSLIFSLDLNVSQELADLMFADSLFQRVRAVMEKELDEKVVVAIKASKVLGSRV